MNLMYNMFFLSMTHNGGDKKRLGANSLINLSSSDCERLTRDQLAINCNVYLTYSHFISSRDSLPMILSSFSLLF